MSTCAQNQSNDDESSGAESNALSTAAFDAAVAGGHFLNSSVGKSVAPNGLGARASIQVREALHGWWFHSMLWALLLIGIYDYKIDRKSILL